MSKDFLQAEWRKLAMANYIVDPSVLKDFIPFGTEIDLWNGRCYVSLVGFMFLKTRMRGFAIPFHTEFEEVNLRFYVRYNDGGAWKRGVVFISEIVPKPALSFVANLIYGEHYETMPMRHTWQGDEATLSVEYQWKKPRWNSFKVITSREATPVAESSEEEFITEHYWGYTRIKEQKTSEYEVGHPRWEVYRTIDYTIDVDFASVYGNDFAFLETQKPVSVFMAEGSSIFVKEGKALNFKI